MFIKICGMTSESAVVAAIECGVDAIGFVFAPSARRLTPQRAAELSAQAPRDLLRIAVTCHPEQQLVDEIVRHLDPDYLQTDIEDLAALELPADLSVLPVLRSDEPDPEPLPPRLLFEGPVSGRGIGTNWQRAAQLAKRTELILAGGLHAANVVEAIRYVRPFGVDVSSGVESTRGVKDARRMAEFVTAVRSAGDTRPRGGQRESRSG
ncbi:MAG TPA: phosphoribosylanthranilate isomerase [Steroidobacteraceae bacterium]|jgi:phosphoribosylanthranilate isomerase|nr:phosphoribosylanthranilate isomerase [Steroidobacteraceae bacterium]